MHNSFNSSFMLEVLFPVLVSSGWDPNVHSRSPSSTIVDEQGEDLILPRCSNPIWRLKRVNIRFLSLNVSRYAAAAQRASSLW